MKRIGIMTGTRAEYGLLKPLMQEINKDNDLELYLIVSGMHLSPEFGMTYKEIEEDGFQINAKVEMLLSSDSPVGISKSIGLGIIGFADEFQRADLDMLILLGDRYEALSAAICAMVMRIPIAHLHGGELTEGAIDEGIRHSITKMSYLHFTSTEEYRRRVIQLGENPERVFCVGAIGVENIKKINLMTKEELERSIHFEIDENTVIVKLISHLMLYILLTVAAIGDFKNYRISNRLILTGLGCAFLFRLVGGKVASIIWFLPDIVFPVVILYFLYLSGILGAGDIKLFSVVCAFTNLRFTALCMAAAFVAAAGYGLISMVLKKELFVRMRDGFLYLNGILCGRFMRYRGQGKAVSFAVYVLLGTAMADIWFYGMR